MPFGTLPRNYNTVLKYAANQVFFGFAIYLTYKRLAHKLRKKRWDRRERQERARQEKVNSGNDSSSPTTSKPTPYQPQSGDKFCKG
jgi:hypothetical protein